MNNNFIYYSPTTETVCKRKYLLFLEKSGFEIDKLHSEDDLRVYLQFKCPVGMIVTEDCLEDILQYITFPILMILKPEKNASSLMEKYMDLNIFFRFENDPISTILETAIFMQKLNSYS